MGCTWKQEENNICHYAEISHFTQHFNCNREIYGFHTYMNQEHRNILGTEQNTLPALFYSRRVRLSREQTTSFSSSSPSLPVSPGTLACAQSSQRLPVKEGEEEGGVVRGAEI